MLACSDITVTRLSRCTSEIRTFLPFSSLKRDFSLKSAPIYRETRSHTDPLSNIQNVFFPGEVWGEEYIAFGKTSKIWMVHMKSVCSGGDKECQGVVQHLCFVG